MTEDQKKLLRELLYAAQPEFGKRFTAVLEKYIEECQTDVEKRLIENIVRNKIDRESKMIFFRIIRRLIENFA